MTSAFEIRGMVRRFPEFQLGPLTLALEPGTVLGYVGPNGSGKTTTMHCLSGLLRLDEGEIEIFGCPNNLDKPDWKLSIGYVGDAHPYYERWTGERNLRFLQQFYPEWSEALVADLAARFDFPLERKVRDLSTGNRVKLSLIAALAHSPKLLLFDEPTAGLDPVVRTEVVDVLFEILEPGDRAMFYSTHILSDISRLADELAFLKDGQVFQRSTTEDLTEQWRKISFRSETEDLELAGAVSHRREGAEHQVVSSSGGSTLRQLSVLGAEDVQENRMSIDEITVEILKGGSDVAHS